MRINQIHSYLLMCACGMVLGQFAHASQDDVIVNNQTFGTGTDSAEWANYTIESTGTTTVQTGADVRWSAGETILLNPGFSVQAGAYFSASISAYPLFNPGGYYTINPPLLAPISSDIIYGLAGGFNAQPFDIAIWNESGTAPLVNAPVLVLLESGTGGLAISTAASPPYPHSLQLTTDQDGTIQFYYYQPATGGLTGRIRVVTGNRTFVFNTQSYTITPGTLDQDSDGLSDATETLLGTNLNSTAATATNPDLGLVIHF